jgi:hypothetical protein
MDEGFPAEVKCECRVEEYRVAGAAWPVVILICISDRPR